MNYLAIHLGHNATVALSKNGEIISVISEERLTRVKNFTGFPVEALKTIKKNYLNNNFSKIDNFLFIDHTGLALNYIKKNFKSETFGSYGWEDKKNFFKY